MSLRQFQLENKKVIDITCGKIVTIVKTQSTEDNQIQHYAIINQIWGKENEDDLLKYWKIVGIDTLNDYFGNYIKSLAIDSSKVTSFACAKTATFMSTQDDSSSSDRQQNHLSMIPAKPYARGLIHFYQETQVRIDGKQDKKWVFLTEEEY